MSLPEFFRQVSIFRGLPDEELSALAAIASEWECLKDQLIYREGDESDVLYILREGEAAATVSTGLLANRPLMLFHSPDVFGELAFLDRQTRSATVRCTQPSRLVSFTRTDFAHLGRQWPDLHRIVYKNMARVLAQRLRVANQTLIELAGRDRHIFRFLPDVLGS